MHASDPGQLRPFLPAVHLPLSPRTAILLLRARALHLQPLAARTQLECRSKFTLVPPPFPNSSNRDFPQIPISGHRSTPTSSDPFEPSPRATEHPNSSTESHWYSRAPPTLVTPWWPHRHCSVAGDVRASSGLPTATIRLVVSCSFFSPTSPTSSHRPKDVSSSSSFSQEGALADGTYNVVPVDEEEVPEGGADVVVIDPEPDSVLAQEGKPRSMT
nr:unnamed protein product [Digitaria exilis]